MLLAWSAGVVAPARTVRAAVSTPVVGLVAVPQHSSIATAMKAVADYYRPTYRLASGVRNGWSWSTYFQGIHSLFRTVGDQKYVDDGIAWGASNQWSITTAEPNPDSMKAGQTYYDLRVIDTRASLANVDAAMARDLTGLPVSAYYWADALFMGLPNWTRWAARTADPAYLAKMNALYVWTRDQLCGGTVSGGLYDPDEQLWYRDCNFIGKRDAAGHKIFWGRGNGWVIAAAAQVLATLPAGDPRAATYRDMLRGMAARLRQLQGTDGFWRSNLLSPALYPQPEASSTALIAYAMAYGVNTGLLDRATYVPVVTRAWNGLAGAARQSTGFLSFCQPPGAQPAAPYTGSSPQVAPTGSSAGTLHRDSPPYCVGAFLLAGSEMARLTGPMSTGRPVTATAEQVGNEAAHILDGDMTTRWSALGFPQSVTIDLGALYRASNAIVVPYLDRVYRYRIDTSADGVNWLGVVDRASNTAAGSTVDNFIFGTVNLRYARLTVTGVYANPTTWVSIREFAVHDRYDPRPNLARSRPTTATSSQTAYPPSLATDNRSSTFWVAAGLPTGAAPQDLTIDLQSPTGIDTVRVFSRAGYGPRDVGVLSSQDGLTWIPLATATLPNAEGPHMMLFPPTQVRWLRLRSTNAYSLSNVQIEEFEAYAARSAATSTTDHPDE